MSSLSSSQKLADALAIREEFWNQTTLIFWSASAIWRRCFSIRECMKRRRRWIDEHWKGEGKWLQGAGNRASFLHSPRIPSRR